MEIITDNTCKDAMKCVLTCYLKFSVQSAQTKHMYMYMTHIKPEKKNTSFLMLKVHKFITQDLCWCLKEFLRMISLTGCNSGTTKKSLPLWQYCTVIKRQMLSFIHALVKISCFLSCATIAAGERYIRNK
jgi:hypothetical protein